MNSPSNDPRRLARSEDIPRAVEKLIQWVIRLVCYGVAFLLTAAAIASLTNGWHRLVGAVLLTLAAAAVWFGRRYGGPCPLVYIPRNSEKSDAPGRPDKSRDSG